MIINYKKYILLSILILFILAYIIYANRVEFVGLQIELNDDRIIHLRNRAKELNPLQFKTEEVVVIYNGKRKIMTYEEFLEKMEMK